MTDPTQYIVDQSHLHNVLRHEGVLGKGTDFLTGNSCSLNLYTDKFKRTYVMQQFEAVDQIFVSDKMTRITKMAHSHFSSNTTRLCFVCTRKNSKNLFDLSLFYDATGVYGYSLEYVIKMKIKNSEKFDQSEIMGFFWQISDFLMLSARHTGEFLEITPVNVFCKPDEYYGFNFFPNNFGLSFTGTKWERKYYNPSDHFWTKEKTLENAMRSTMFSLGMILLELSCLLPTSQLYLPNGLIDEKVLKKRIEGVKVTMGPQLANIISGLLILDESKRMRIEEIYNNKELLKTRRIDYFQNKADIFGFKTFQGVVDFDRKTATGEGLDSKMCLHRGKFQSGKLNGLGLRETEENSYIHCGVFLEGNFQQGLTIKKNQYVEIISQSIESPNRVKGIRISLNISNLKKDKSDKNLVIASEGQFVDGKLEKGKNYLADGREEIV